MDTLEDIGRKIAALNLWEAAAKSNWAIKPRGVAYPYFCTLLRPGEGLAGHLVLLEGWQTFHDFVITRCDNSFGFYSTPAELPHFAMLAGKDGHVAFFRHDTGYAPRVKLTDAEAVILRKLLWEVYGVFLRLESDSDLAMKFAQENAVFARIEGADGKWADAPLPLTQPRPHVERIALRKDDVAAAKELPFEQGETLAFDFRLMPGLQTNEPRPRSAYLFCAIDAKSGAPAIRHITSIKPDGGIRELWENLAPRLLKALVARRRVPGEIQVMSQRVFRMLRPLCNELPFKLSLHDSIPALDAAFK